MWKKHFDFRQMNPMELISSIDSSLLTRSFRTTLVDVLILAGSGEGSDDFSPGV